MPLTPRWVTAAELCDLFRSEAERQSTIKTTAEVVGDPAAAAVAAGLSEFCSYLARDLAVIDAADGTIPVRDTRTGSISRAYRRRVKDK